MLVKSNRLKKKLKAVSHRKDPPLRHSTPPQNVLKHKEQKKESNFDTGKLASARKRFQESYKEAENAKKQRTVQVMDIHELPQGPKPRNGFFPKSKGSGSQGRHWRFGSLIFVFLHVFDHFAYPTPSTSTAPEPYVTAPPASYPMSKEESQKPVDFETKSKGDKFRKGC
ncbi:probable mediator of RNA polymerase II transcription subunit 26b [Hibiscus syriacus]|uniref:probable mediator of RNA polymerase II transcription subunit 26b n=1 Tax=Hibiscus syriacus TaxID=106335 RepID=UPI0019238D36|nr:probable mediator of RNA polymerase II transcription subunit 26b [Hibiscus syriacus]